MNEPIAEIIEHLRAWAYSGIPMNVANVLALCDAYEMIALDNAVLADRLSGAELERDRLGAELERSGK